MLINLTNPTDYTFLTIHPYAEYFGITNGFNEEFARYAREVAEAISVELIKKGYKLD